MLLTAEMHVPITGELLLGLPHEGIQAGLDVRKAVSNVRHQSGVEGLGQEVGAAAHGDVPVGRVVAEEIRLGLQSLLHGLVSLDILLRPVHDADPAQFQGVDAPRENVERVGAVVHQVDLGEHTNGPPPQGIDMAGELEGFRVDDVDICGGHGEDDAVGLGNVLGYQVPRLLLDVCGLVPDGHL